MTSPGFKVNMLEATIDCSPAYKRHIYSVGEPTIFSIPPTDIAYFCPATNDRFNKLFEILTAVFEEEPSNRLGDCIVGVHFRLRLTVMVGDEVLPEATVPAEATSTAPVSGFNDR